MTPSAPPFDVIVSVQMPMLTSGIGYVAVENLWKETGRPATRWRSRSRPAAAWMPLPKPAARDWEKY